MKISNNIEISDKNPPFIIAEVNIPKDSQTDFSSLD